MFKRVWWIQCFVFNNISIYFFLWLALPSVLRNEDSCEVLEVWIILKAFQACLVTAAEPLRNWPEKHLIQIIYEIPTFPEVLSLGTSYEYCEWITHLDAFFYLPFFPPLTTISSKMSIVWKFYKLHFYIHLPPVLTIGVIIYNLQLNKGFVLSFIFRTFGISLHIKLEWLFIKVYAYLVILKKKKKKALFRAEEGSTRI